MTLLKPEPPDPLTKSAGACFTCVRFDESRNEVYLLDVVRVPTALDVGVSLLEEESGRPYPGAFNALNIGYVSARLWRFRCIRDGAYVMLMRMMVHTVGMMVHTVVMLMMVHT
jgi:hypothetical protein